MGLAALQADMSLARSQDPTPLDVMHPVPEVATFITCGQVRLCSNAAGGTIEQLST
jgi:hypothetical protein